MNQNPLIKSLSYSKILVADDDTNFCHSIAQVLEANGAIVRKAYGFFEAKTKFYKFKPDVVVCDVNLPDGNGLELLKIWHQQFPNLPVVLVSTDVAVESTIAALRLGAFDYFKKPIPMENLLASIKRAAETAYLREKVKSIENVTKKRDQLQIIGSSKIMEEHRMILEKIAKSKSDTSLIIGESGTGKELAAHAIHDWSARYNEPHVEINCASIPESLLESELFGHEKGAFTDARNKKTGLFEIAGKGTVFLDEIGEMPINLQSKLLRVLETRRFRRLGGTSEIEVNAHITAATNKNLLYEVKEGKFRGDLYYRLNALPVKIPALRKRREDIPELAVFFIKTLSKQLEIPRAEFSKDALEKLMNYNWPGNIRELKNVLHRCLVFYSPDFILAKHILLDTEDTLEDDDEQQDIESSEVIQLPHIPENSLFKLPDAGINLDELEKSLLIQALERARHNQTKAAKLLNISRHTLRYRLEKHGLIQKSSENEE